tara:strand:+ start:203686 stop:204171 length:486 start_codon:yes stop_codon:yes gene_type:complete
MTQSPFANLAISSALWLSLLPMAVQAQEIGGLPAQSPSEQAQIFLNAGSLTSIEPLFITFHPQQITLEEDNLKKLKKWLQKIKKSDVPIHVYSYATPPISRMDMTEKSAHHMAIRKAFNRALDAKNALENEGVAGTQIALHAIGPADDNPGDQLRITIRNN